MMKSFDYTSPATIDEALSALRGNGSGMNRPLAGGTDLLTLMKADLVAPALLVDIKRAAGLPAGIAEDSGGLRIGALTTLAELEAHPLIRDRYPALAESAALAATPQLRNMATLGGNLLQRPRCWYFRNPRINCWLKGGDDCPARDGENQLHALFGDSPCVAVHPSDPAVALLALDAEVTVRGRAGERRRPLGDFFCLPSADRRAETTIGDDELVVAVHLPASNSTTSAFLKAMDRKVWAFALVSVAVAARLGGPTGRRLEAVRLMIGGVAPIPWRAAVVEQLLTGANLTPALLDRASTMVAAEASPLRHNGYKVTIMRALVRRALAAVTGIT